MPSPFPGMVPYRESPALWPDVRNTIFGLIRELHSPGLRPDCFCQVEDRVRIVDEDDPARKRLRASLLIHNFTGFVRRSSIRWVMAMRIMVSLVAELRS